MEQFASTVTLMGLLQSGRYKRLVMENKEDTLKSEADFEAAFEDYKEYTSNPHNFDYFTRRQVQKTNA